MVLFSNLLSVPKNPLNFLHNDMDVTCLQLESLNN